jgi:hypothetical protein
MVSRCEGGLVGALFLSTGQPHCDGTGQSSKHPSSGPVHFIPGKGSVRPLPACPVDGGAGKKQPPQPARFSTGATPLFCFLLGRALTLIGLFFHVRS